MTHQIDQAVATLGEPDDGAADTVSVGISATTYNRSRLAAVLAAVISSNTTLATMPGNVFLPATTTGLPRDSVVNVTALVTLNKTDLSNAPPALLNEVDRGLRRVLDL